MSIKKSLAAGALALALPMSAMAATDFKINGFANAGFAWVDSSETYLFSDKDGSFNESSFMGLQMRFAPNVDVPISFVTQLIARGRDDWNLEADWAYVSWQATEDFTVNVGRVKLPIFLISEAYDVGVTYPWIAPPEEIYGFANIPFTAMTGFNLDYNHFFDETWINAKFYMGRDNMSIPTMGTDIPGEITRMYGASFSFGTESLELRASVSTVEFSMQISDAVSSLPIAQNLQAEAGAAMMTATGLLALLNAAGDGTSNGNADAQETLAALGIVPGDYGTKQTETIEDLKKSYIEGQFNQSLFAAVPNGNGEAEFYSAGMRYDGDSIFFMTEVARRSVRGLPFPDSNTGFVTLGYRLNKMMPHFTYSVHESEDSILVNQTQTSAILGLRYDIQPWAALKFEAQYIELGDDNIRTSGPLAGTDQAALPSTGLFNELPALDTFTGDVPDEVIKLQVAYTMVF